MPKLKNKFPKLCQDGKQAYSWHNGKRIYHGVYGTPEAQKSYNRFIAGLVENFDQPLRKDKIGDTLVFELAAGFLRFVEPRWTKLSSSILGEPSAILSNFMEASTSTSFRRKS